ncbi:RNA-directed DNA polymerase, eukaryota, reverse transcriptase zinc-binding domain protein [Tanacetum coccineum]
MEGFDKFVEKTWSEIQVSDSDDMSKFTKKLKCLKEKICAWIKNKKENSNIQKKKLKADLVDIDLLLDKGEGDSNILNKRVFVSKSIQDIEKLETMEVAQKAKIKWAIEGDENSKYYHSILNKRRSQLVVRDSSRLHLNSDFHNKLTMEQKTDLECDITREEIKRAAWDCGIDKSPGPDEFSFGFYRRGSVIVNGTSIQLSHLSYADDAVFMGQWSDSNIEIIIQVLECFHRASGLRINMSKSSKVEDLMSRSRAWSDIINKLTDRLSKWKMKTLSVGGRLTLLKSIVGSMPIYHMSLFKVPKKILHSMESIRCHFFNGIDKSSKKPIWIKWDKVLAPKENEASVIKGIHGVDSNLNKNVNDKHPSIWLDIMKETMHLKNQGTDLCGFIQKKIGNGIDTSFWEEIWRGDSAFKFLYPRLYALEPCKSITVAEKLGHTNLASSFRRQPRGGIEQEQFLHLLTRLDDISLVDMRDMWSWSMDGTWEFFIVSVRKTIDESYLPEVSSKTRWIKIMPIKINIHAWKVKMDCLPTRLNISRRGMDIKSIPCLSCGMGVESTSHVFFTCNLVRQVWVKIANWWDVNYMDLSSYAKWLDWFSSLQLHPKHKNLFEGVCYAMWWYMWNFRNKSIFGLDPPNKASIYEDIISRSFFLD